MKSNVSPLGLGFTALAFLTLFTGCLFLGEPKPQSWAEDLLYLRQELPRRHAQPFTSISQERWNRQLSELANQSAELTIPLLKGELRPLLHQLDRGQTRLIPEDDNLYFPLGLYDFSNGLYALALPPAYRKLLGTRLVAIEGVPIEEILSRLAAQLPHGNQSHLRRLYPKGLVSLSLLRSIRIAEDDKELRFIFENSRGQRSQASLTARPGLPGQGLDPDKDVEEESLVLFPKTGAKPGLKSLTPPPSFLMNSTDGTAYLRINRISRNPDPEGSAFYFRFSPCRPGSETSTEAFEALSKALSAGRISRLILDYRYPGRVSEDEGLTQALSRLLQGHDYLDILILIGRETRNCTTGKALTLKRDTGALLLGEPTGGRPNYFTGIETLTLPFSGLTVEYPTRFVQNLTKSDPDALYPDIYVSLLWEDFTAGRDTALLKALSLELSNGRE